MMNATEPKPTGGDILSVIRTNYPRLSRAQRRIADFILRQPEDACFASLKELTEAVGTTEVTVMNFTRRLGIDGFTGLKRELQAYIRMRLSPNEKITYAMENVRSRSEGGFTTISVRMNLLPYPVLMPQSQKKDCIRRQPCSKALGRSFFLAMMFPFQWSSFCCSGSTIWAITPFSLISQTGASCCSV